MTNPNDEAAVAKIAAGLTKAQREAVRRASYQEEDGGWWPAGWYTRADKRVRLALVRAGVIRDYLRPTNRLTPLGLAVRAHLTANPDA